MQAQQEVANMFKAISMSDAYDELWPPTAEPTLSRSRLSSATPMHTLRLEGQDNFRSSRS